MTTMIDGRRLQVSRLAFTGQGGGALDSRMRLVTMVRQECEKAGIGWATWEDPVNMHLFDSLAGTWLTGIVDALLPP